MARIKDETGRKYGRLTVLGLSNERRSRQAVWMCRCTCGEVTKVYGASLRSGQTKSCGCLQREIRTGMNVMKRPFMHGHPARASYKCARSRCENPNNQAFKNYGGRGIRFMIGSFEHFWEVLGPTWEPGLSIDRINNDGHYEPGNCRWATATEQIRNRRNTIRVVYSGREVSVAEAARMASIKPDTLRWRIKHLGGDHADLFNKPQGVKP